MANNETAVDAEIDVDRDNDDLPEMEDEAGEEELVKAFVYYKASYDKDECTITMKLLPASKPAPAPLLSFISEVLNVENSIHALLPRADKTRMMEALFGIAKVGGTSTYFGLASSNLDQMKSEMIVTIGNKIKYRYISYYAKCVGLTVFALLLLLAALEYFKVTGLGFLNIDYTKNAILMLTGTAIGAWLTFAIQKREVTFQELRVLNDHTTSTKIRLGVILLISLCLFLMFVTGFLNIKIGEQFSTDALTQATGHNFAFVLGLMIGLSESKIGLSLTSKIETLMAKI